MKKIIAFSLLLSLPAFAQSSMGTPATGTGAGSGAGTMRDGRSTPSAMPSRTGTSTQQQRMEDSGTARGTNHGTKSRGTNRTLSPATPKSPNASTPATSP